jgi:hypothetical protein
VRVRRPWGSRMGAAHSSKPRGTRFGRAQPLVTVGHDLRLLAFPLVTGVVGRSLTQLHSTSLNGAERIRIAALHDSVDRGMRKVSRPCWSLRVGADWEQGLDLFRVGEAFNWFGASGAAPCSSPPAVLVMGTSPAGLVGRRCPTLRGRRDTTAG